MITLFPYQEKIIADIDTAIAAGKKRILIPVPTGGGKTIIAGHITKRWITNYSSQVLFVAHRNELLSQAADKLQRFDIYTSIIKAGREKEYRPFSRVQIAGIQTLHARAIRTNKLELPPAALVWIDEAHHIRARTYQNVIDQYPDAILIGLTATPCRGDGRGLGNVFETMIEGPQIKELIDLKYLVPTKIFAPPPPDLKGVTVASTGDYVISELAERVDTDPLVGDIITHWLKHAERRRTVIFTVNVAHSIHICDELQKAGVRAEHLDALTEASERNAILGRLASGETECISNCGILTEGYDLPDLGCIVLARPTKSLGLFRQMIGRGLRTAPDKDHVIILDHSGGVHRHGRPDDHITWTLDVDRKAENRTHEARKAKAGTKDMFCECSACGHLRIPGEACDNCGWTPHQFGRGVEYIDGELIEYGANAKSGPPTTETKKIFFAELRGYQRTARKRDGSSYAAGWAAHKYKLKYGQFPPWDWNSHPTCEPSLATRRWIKSRVIAYAKAVGR